MKHSETLELVGHLLACYPTAQVGPDTVKAYTALLVDLPFPVARAAVDRVVAMSRFFPSVAEIREAAAALADQDAPSPEHAWAEVSREVRTKGYNRRPEFTHERIRQAVDAVGGWSALCGSDNEHADRAHFWKAYQAMTAKAREAVILRNATPITAEEARGLLAGETLAALTSGELQHVRA